MYGGACPTTLMLTPHDIHHGIILPAFLALVVMLAALVPKLRSRGTIVLLVALVVPFVFSFMHLFDRPALPPVEVWGWLFWLPIAALPVGLIIDASGVRSLGLPVFFLSSALILWGILGNESGFGESATIVSLIAGASFLSYLSLCQLSTRMGGRSMHVMMLLMVAATAQVVGMSGSRTLGQIPLILAAALLGTMGVVWWLKIAVSAGVLLMVVMLWHGFLMAGNFAASLKAEYALLLAIAPHLAWVAEGQARQWRAGARVALRFGAVLVPLLIAQFIVWREFEVAMRELGY